MKNALRTFVLTLTVLATGCAELRNGDQPSDSITEPRYFLGELRYTEITSIERAWRGVQVALKEMNYQIKSSQYDLLQAKIIAVAPGREVKIELEENSPTTTEIRIRAGKLGDKVLANEILLGIRKHI